VHAAQPKYIMDQSLQGRDAVYTPRPQDSFDDHISAALSVTELCDLALRYAHGQSTTPRTHHSWHRAVVMSASAHVSVAPTMCKRDLTHNS
jgi:hypothetical protein